jgi:hypothetical protein
MAISSDTKKLREERKALSKRLNEPTKQERLRDEQEAAEAARLFPSAPRERKGAR